MFLGPALKLPSFGILCTGKKADVLYSSRDSCRLFYFVCHKYSAVAVPVQYMHSLPLSQRLSCRDRDDETVPTLVDTTLLSCLK